jgi:lipopolysaccharide transport system ATP-binding protein
LDGGRAKAYSTAREAITAYVNGSSPTSLLFDRTERRGSGLIRFTDILFFDEDGAPLRTLIGGRTALVELFVRNDSARSLELLHISIGVHNQLGQRVTTWSTSYVRDDIPITPAGDFVVRLWLPRLALLPGSYTFYLYATVKGEVADWLLPAGAFDVEAGDFYGTGRVPESGDALFMTDHSFDVVPIKITADKKSVPVA